jgi:hypothetical protein
LGIDEVVIVTDVAALSQDTIYWTNVPETRPDFLIFASAPRPRAVALLIESFGYLNHADFAVHIEVEYEPDNLGLFLDNLEFVTLGVPSITDLPPEIVPLTELE